MKEFDLKKALNGAPICTRKGIPASIVQFNYNILKGTDIIVSFKDCNGFKTIKYTTGGKAKDGMYNEDYDLFMATIKKEGWINIYLVGDGSNKNVYPGATIYTDKDAAAMAATNDGTDLIYLSTAKVTWEE